MTIERRKEDEATLLGAMRAAPRSSIRQWCRDMGWVTAKGEQVSRVQNTLYRLHRARLVRRYKRKWVVLKALQTPAFRGAGDA